MNRAASLVGTFAMLRPMEEDPPQKVRPCPPPGNRRVGRATVQERRTRTIFVFVCFHE